MAEEDRKSPIDWEFGNSESDENGVLLDVILTFHDLDNDSSMEKEIETCRFSFEEVDAKLDRYGIGNERYFYRANVAKKLSEEIAKVEEALEKRLANFAKDSLADAKIPPRTRVSLAKDYFLSNNYCQKMLYEIGRLTVIKREIMRFSPLDEIKANETLLDHYIGVVYYC